MNLSAFSEFWLSVRDVVRSDDDRSSLAHSLVSILIENNVEFDEIIYEFDRDPDINEAVKMFKSEIEEYEDDYDDEDYS